MLILLIRRMLRCLRDYTHPIPCHEKRIRRLAGNSTPRPFPTAYHFRLQANLRPREIRTLPKDPRFAACRCRIFASTCLDRQRLGSVAVRTDQTGKMDGLSRLMREICLPPERRCLSSEKIQLTSLKTRGNLFP
jgi:hypothetical protein